jgi:hypothetical protein
MEDEEFEKLIARIEKKYDGLEAEWDELTKDILRRNRSGARSHVDALMRGMDKYDALLALLPEDDARWERTEDPEPSVDEIIADAEELLKDFPEPKAKPKRKRSKKVKK